MRFPPPQAEIRVLPFEPETEQPSPEQERPIIDTNGYPFVARLIVRGKLFWEIGLDSPNLALAKSALLRQVQKQAPTVNVEAFAQGLANTLSWPKESALALTIAFLFPMIPSRLVGWRRADSEKPRGRGRPEVADSLTRQIWNLMNAWTLVTGKKPATSRRTAFARAVGVAAEHLPIYMRYRSERVVAAADEIHRVVQREAKKMISGRFFMVPPGLAR